MIKASKLNLSTSFKAKIFLTKLLRNAMSSASEKVVGSLVVAKILAIFEVVDGFSVVVVVVVGGVVLVVVVIVV